MYKNTKKKPSFSHTNLSRKQESYCLYLLGLARQSRFLMSLAKYIYIIERKKLRIKLNKNIKSNKK